jgi:hypothetical protein
MVKNVETRSSLHCESVNDLIRPRTVGICSKSSPLMKHFLNCSSLMLCPYSSRVLNRSKLKHFLTSPSTRSQSLSNGTLALMITSRFSILQFLTAWTAIASMTALLVAPSISKVCGFLKRSNKTRHLCRGKPTLPLSLSVRTFHKSESSANYLSFLETRQTLSWSRLRSRYPKMLTHISEFTLYFQAITNVEKSIRN